MSRFVIQGLVSARGRRGFRLLRERLYGPLLKQYGFDPRAGAYAREPAARTQRRVQIVTALIGTAGGGEVRRTLAAATQAYLAGDRTALDPAWIDHALDLYTFNNGEAGARALVEHGLASEDPVFRPAALAAAARTSNLEVARWLLELDDPRLRESEKRTFLEGIMSRSATRELGYQWALAHIDMLLAGGEGQFQSRRIPQVLDRFCSVAWANRIAADFATKLAATPGALELDRAIERVRNCGLLDDMMGKAIDDEFAALR